MSLPIRFGFLLPLVLLAGCGQDNAQSSIPVALALTEEAAGHYCQMVILEHDGPKAQVHMAGYPDPLWFSQVRDGLAYLKSPDQFAPITVLYVNDMGEAVSWAEPGIDNWIVAREAFFVVGSDAIGGMGAPEIAPFGDRTKAQQFAVKHGGQVMRLDDIPIEAVLAPVDFETASLEDET